MSDSCAVRLCFVSGHEFGHGTLQSVLESDEHRSGLITVTLVMSLDDFCRSRTVGYACFDDLAARAEVENIRVTDATLVAHYSQIAAAEPDYLLVIGWSRLIPPKILDLPAKIKGVKNRHSAGHGCIGMHPSPLPVGRGRAPIPWSIIKGLRTTALSVFLLEEQADNGPIIMQLPVTIGAAETATTLFERFSTLHYRAGRLLAPVLARRQLSATPQNETEATVWPRRRPRDGHIDFNQDCQSIERLVRALARPYPPATFCYETHEVEVFAVRPHAVRPVARPGTVIGLAANGHPLVATKDGAVELLAFRGDAPLAFAVGGICS